MNPTSSATEVSAHQPAPNPGIVLDNVHAILRTFALKAAIELDLFTAIGEGNTTAETIAKRCESSERGIRILSDFMVIAGLLKKSGNEYGLTIDSGTFLDKRSPSYIGSVTRFLNHPYYFGAYEKLTDAVKKGTTQLPQDGTVTIENPIWVDFARGMAPLIFPIAIGMAELLAERLPAKSKVLDLAAGHGLFGITVLQKLPEAKAIAIDAGNVLEVAGENAAKFGVSDRYRLQPGNAFAEDFGKDNDVVLLTNFLHHFDVPTCENLLRRVHASLKPGGWVATVEFIPNDDRVTPPDSAYFSMVMLATTPSGDAYTFKELESMFRNAGFPNNSMHILPQTNRQVVLSQRD